MRSSATSGPPSALTLLAEFGGAIVGGLIMALLLALAVGLLLAGTPLGMELGMGVLTLQIYAGIIGFALGGGIGVALVGRLMQQGGSIWLAMLCGVISGAVVAVLPRVLPLRIDLIGTLGLAAIVALVGAVAGYNLRRRP